MDLYLIHLQGQGDTDLTLVNDNVWDYINNAGELNEESLSHIHAQCKNGLNKYDDIVADLEDKRQNPEGSSPVNDRAAMADFVTPSGRSFYSMQPFLSYVQGNNINVLETYVGYIY